jgi:Holliday junction resolvasome RuvABC endonuclease subunit
MYVVSPSTLKTFVCGRGKGKAKKELMLMRCALKFKQEFEDNNICDAYCLARYAIKNSSKLRENWRENRKKV